MNFIGRLVMAGAAAVLLTACGKEEKTEAQIAAEGELRHSGYTVEYAAFMDFDGDGRRELFAVETGPENLPGYVPGRMRRYWFLPYEDGLNGVSYIDEHDVSAGFEVDEIYEMDFNLNGMNELVVTGVWDGQRRTNVFRPGPYSRSEQGRRMGRWYIDYSTLGRLAVVDINRDLVPELVDPNTACESSCNTYLLRWGVRSGLTVQPLHSLDQSVSRLSAARGGDQRALAGEVEREFSRLPEALRPALAVYIEGAMSDIAYLEQVQTILSHQQQLAANPGLYFARTAAGHFSRGMDSARAENEWRSQPYVPGRGCGDPYRECVLHANPDYRQPRPVQPPSIDRSRPDPLGDAAKSGYRALENAGNRLLAPLDPNRRQQRP